MMHNKRRLTQANVTFLPDAAVVVLTVGIEVVGGLLTVAEGRDARSTVRGATIAAYVLRVHQSRVQLRAAPPTGSVRATCDCLHHQLHIDLHLCGSLHRQSWSNLSSGAGEGVTVGRGVGG
jgi:hypothetical protein